MALCNDRDHADGTQWVTLDSGQQPTRANDAERCETGDDALRDRGHHLDIEAQVHGGELRSEAFAERDERVRWKYGFDAERDRPLETAGKLGDESAELIHL